MRYKGEQMRSTLEADWAATLDHYQIAWEYEPLALNMDDGIKYLPDFHLPHQRVWAEVKGPSDDNIGKAIEFQKLLERTDAHKWDFEQQLVVILRPSRGGMAVWEGTAYAQDIVVIRCANCDRFAFMDYAATWKCRFCHMDGKQIFNHPGDIFRNGDLEFHRAPRQHRRAA